MIKNYLKVALRNLLLQKSYAVINMFGLSLGLTCCLLVALYVRYELSFDRYHENTPDIYRVVEDIISPEETVEFASTAGPVGPRLERDFPEVIRAVRFKGAEMLMQYEDKRFQETTVYFTDPTVFKVFTFSVLRGNPNTALTAPLSIALSRSAAKKYFGEKNPIGETLVLDKKNPFVVTAVFQDIPSNSHLSFDFLVSMSTLEKNGPGSSDGWEWSMYTYVQLAPGYDATHLNERLRAFSQRQLDDRLLKKGGQRALSLQPLTDIHLHSQRTGEPSSGGLSNVYMLSFIGFFILLIGSINFINLTTARANRRAKEVGMRKVIGGTKLQLIFQFLTESVLMSLGGAVLALVLSGMLLPAFNDLMGLKIAMDALVSGAVIPAFIAISLLLGVLAGSYSAFFLSGFQPASILKGASALPGGSFLRKSLIVFQFTISVVLIVATVTVFAQLRFMQTQNLGYNRNQMLILSFGDDTDIQQKAEAVKQEFLRSPYIDTAASSSHVPGKDFASRQAIVENRDGIRKNIDVRLFAVDLDFLSLYKIELLAGRGFSSTHRRDETNVYIVNESAVRKFGFQQPDNLLGVQLELDGQMGTIIGVVKDFHFESLHRQIEPLVIRMRTKSLSYISIPLRAGAVNATMTDVEKTWRRLAPHRPFDYFFLDEQFDLQYRSDVQFGKAFGIAAGIAIMLACLGLLGLVAFTVQQRTKEIGIRKVHGASVIGVSVLLLKDFIKLVFLAVLIATPVAWYATDVWLQDFAYHVQPQWWIFTFVGLFVVVLAFMTVSLQSVKAALMNPVKSLRTE